MKKNLLCPFAVVIIFNLIAIPLLIFGMGKIPGLFMATILNFFIGAHGREKEKATEKFFAGLLATIILAIYFCLRVLFVNNKYYAFIWLFVLVFVFAFSAGHVLIAFFKENDGLNTKKLIFGYVITIAMIFSAGFYSIIYFQPL